MRPSSSLALLLALALVLVVVTGACRRAGVPDAPAPESAARGADAPGDGADEERESSSGAPTTCTPACEGGLVCAAGACGGCTEDASCGPGRVCEGGRCGEPASCAAELACREDADCRRGPLARCVARCCELAATELVVEDCQIKLSGRFDWEPGRHHVLPRYAGLLDELARLLAAHEDVRLSIDVHIDQQGSDRYGHSPTRRRADNIRRYLVEQGIAAERLVARGFGEEVPLESNETPEGRARNRRVEFWIQGCPPLRR